MAQMDPTVSTVQPIIGTDHGKELRQKMPTSACVSFSASSQLHWLGQCRQWWHCCPCCSRPPLRYQILGRQVPTRSVSPELLVVCAQRNVEQKMILILVIGLQTLTAFAQQGPGRPGSGNDYLKKTEHRPWFTGSCKKDL